MSELSKGIVRGVLLAVVCGVLAAVAAVALLTSNVSVLDVTESRPPAGILFESSTSVQGSVPGYDCRTVSDVGCGA